MKLKDIPSKSSRISEAISKKFHEDKTKTGVDLDKIAKELAKRNYENSLEEDK